MKTLIEYTVLILAVVNLLLTRFILFKLKQPTTMLMWMIKVLVGAISPILFLLALLITGVGIYLNSYVVVAAGVISTVIHFVFILRSSGSGHSWYDFENVFGKDWELQIRSKKKTGFPGRFAFKLPFSTGTVLKQNVPFGNVEETSRRLLCDLWLPPENQVRSGLAFIYLHGSAWTSLDKDYGTRPFFRHLAAQGHVIMDVAYRLFPETDFIGMLHDTKRAIAWMKENASTLQVNPDHIVIGGGSAGAHLALLAAYTAEYDELNPPDLEHADLRVQGVISFYGQADLKATYYHTCQHLAKRSALSPKKNGEPGGMPSWIGKKMGKDFHRLGFDKKVEPGMLNPILGGSPAEESDAYSFFSPITYVHEDCPVTLFIHGTHDILAPLHAIHHLVDLLTAKGVRTILHEIPQADHAFDLVFPQISPAAHNAIQDVDKFLTLLAPSTTEMDIAYTRILKD